jgi:hypothetical protein
MLVNASFFNSQSMSKNALIQLIKESISGNVSGKIHY